MGWLSIVLFVILLIIVLMVSDVYDIAEGLSVTLTVILSYALIFILAIVAAECNHGKNYTVTSTKTLPIYQASLGDKISGSVYMYGGFINENDVYYFYYGDDMGIHKDFIYCDKSVIVEEDECPEPRVILNTMGLYTKEDSWFRRAYFSKRMRDNMRVVELYHQGTVYVPKGTIARMNFNLNL